MQKISSATLLALGSTSALNIDLFTVKNFMSMKPEGFVKSMLSTANQSLFAVTPNKIGDVVYSQCDDDMGVFTFDDASTYNDPSPVVKGSDLNLNLAGIFSDQGTLSNIHIHVDWNGTPLYDEDHNQSTAIGDEFKTTIGWNVPSFAPSGDYDVTLIGTGDISGQTQAKIMCIRAKMTL